MSRPKGSKNKKKSQFVEDTKVVEQPKKEENRVVVSELEELNDEKELSV